MIIPIRCFTCGKLIADKWDTYYQEVQKKYRRADIPARKVDIETDTIENKMLNELGLTRYCCRRMFLTHVDMINLI